MTQFASEVTDLLSRSVEEVKNWETSHFDNLTSGYSGLILFGAGGLGRRTLAGLRQLNIEPITFADNNPALWGKTVDGLPVIPVPEACARFGKSAIFVVTIWGAQTCMGGLAQSLRDFGAECIVPALFIYWKYPEKFLPYYTLDLPHQVIEAADQIRTTISFWQDPISQKEFLDQLRFRLMGEFDGLKNAYDDSIQPFIPGLIQPVIDEVMIDAGAYDGDTIRNFLLWRQGMPYNKIYAFEPDPQNWRALNRFATSMPMDEQKKIELFPYALSSQKEKIHFCAEAGLSSGFGDGSLVVDCVALDELLQNSSPTLIKMDIEGAEVQALKGAEKLIRKHKPRLIICLYHVQDHLWTIPNLIASYCSDYHFQLRTFTYDTICYAE